VVVEGRLFHLQPRYEQANGVVTSPSRAPYLTLVLAMSVQDRTGEAESVNVVWNSRKRVGSAALIYRVLKILRVAV
jgi:hypothetical protein